MGVARADEADLERVAAALLLQREAADQGLPRIAPARIAVGGDLALAGVQDLEVGPLVVGRQFRVGLRRALDLGQLDQRLVAHPLFGEGVVDRAAIRVLEPEHLAVGLVHVVRDRQAVDSLLAQPVHPAPELLRLVRVDARERPRRGLRPREDDVPVVGSRLGRRRRGGPLVGDERGEVARVVVALRGEDRILPGRAMCLIVEGRVLHLRVVRHPRPLLPQEAAVGTHLASEALPEQDRAHLHRVRMQIVAFVHAVEGLRAVQLAYPGRRIGPLRHHAEKEPVVRDGKEVQRLAELHLVAEGVLDRLALGEPVALVRCGVGAEQVGVEGVPGVDVDIAEVDVAVLAVALGLRRRRRRFGVVVDRQGGVRAGENGEAQEHRQGRRRGPERPGGRELPRSRSTSLRHAHLRRVRVTGGRPDDVGHRAFRQMNTLTMPGPAGDAFDLIRAIGSAPCESLRPPDRSSSPRSPRRSLPRPRPPPTTAAPCSTASTNSSPTRWRRRKHPASRSRSNAAAS